MNESKDLAKRTHFAFLAQNYEILTEVRKAGIAIDHSAESAIDAEWAVMVTNGKGSGTKFVLKHLLRENGYYKQLFSEFRILLEKELQNNEDNVWLKNSIMLVNSLLEVMNVSPCAYINHDFCRNIRDIGRQIEGTIGKKLDEAVMFFLHQISDLSDTKDC